MGSIKENVSLAPYTTLKLGGLARYFVEAESVEDVQATIAFAREREFPLFILGGGSNIVVSDDGFPGLVLANRIKKFITESRGEKTIVRAGAGEEWDSVVARTVELGLSGLEALSGIPGRVGAAPVQNIGAYGTDVSSTIIEARTIDLVTGEEKIFSNAECGFAYRDSIFKSRDAGRYCITEVVFALMPSTEPVVSSYADLSAYFHGRPAPSLVAFRNAVIAIRARKGMVIHPEYESYRSVGSFFMNPVIPVAEFQKVKAVVEADGESSPSWFWEQGENVNPVRSRPANGSATGTSGRLASNGVKISAARLIERAGFSKGFRDGAVGISPKHTLALVAMDDATAADVIRLACTIQDGVEKKFGVLLRPEAQCVGFADSPFRV